MRKDPIGQPSISELRIQMVGIRSATKRGAEKILKNWAKRIHLPGNLIDSIHNLAAYLALRHQDLRNLQDELSHHGLSSLGRCESRVAVSLDAVRLLNDVHTRIQVICAKRCPLSVHCTPGNIF